MIDIWYYKYITTISQGDKMQSLKMAWMITWRVWFFSLFFGYQFSLFPTVVIAFIAALVLRYGFKFSIRTFPIFRLIFKRPFFDRYIFTKSAPSHINTQTVEPVSGTVIDKASRPGRETGFEPRHLDSIPVPTSIHMRGVPGIGLSSAAHMNDYSIKTGQMGETNFAKALAVTNFNGTRDYSGSSAGILEKINSFWSVSMPSENLAHKADPVFDTDIDCVIVSGNNILLIDTKFYTSGDVTYTHSGNQLFCTDNATGSMVKKPRTMTRNMEMALQRFKNHYPKMNVSAYVVMMPTNSGSANISNVFWPGNIPALTVEQMISVVHNASVSSGTKVHDHRAIANLVSLQKS